MMTQAYYTGISGLQNSSNGIDVVSNNIANVNTMGYRSSEAEFAPLFEKSISTGVGSSNTVGVGVRTQVTSMVKDQGSFSLSERDTDVAIEGDGWFGIKRENIPEYTRNGSFSFNKNNDLITDDGYYVLGTMGDNISTDNVLKKSIDTMALSDVKKQEKLRFPKSLTYPPKASTKAKFISNLGVGSDPVTIGTTVVDSKNSRNNLHLEFVKNPIQTPPGSQYSVTATTQNIDGTTIYDTKKGTISFDEKGALATNTLSTIDNNGTAVTIDLGSGYDGITSIDVPVTSGSSSTDGTIGGDLVGYTINQNAEIVATFTNGKQSSVAKLAVYHFMNDQGLNRISGTRFGQSANSGEAKFRTDTDGNSINGSKVVNFKLENSNVKLSNSLTKLIIFQRAYDANSKSITTADQMMKKALSMGT